jgi:dienelactone hydrolase
VLVVLRLLHLTLLVLAAAAGRAAAQSDAFGLAAGEHSVGFRLLEDVDASRVVTAGARAAQPRPIRTYLWYPAEDGGRAQAMRFGRYAELADGDIWPAAIGGELRERLRYANGPLARSLGDAGFAAQLARPMRAVENAAPLAGPFPLIAIGLGLYYESPISFATTAEYLAGRGFVVATAPLVGTQTALVKLDVPDLETQIRDLELVIARARQFAFVDPERLGVMGFDQGGMASVVLTMRNRDVDAFVSLDTSIQYPHVSGLPRSSPHYDPRALRVPWLHAASRADGPPPPAGTRSLFDEAVHSERYWLRIADLGHAEFTSYALVAGRGAAAGYWGPVTEAASAKHRAVAEWVLHFFAAHLARSDVSQALLDQALRELPPDAGMTLQFHAAAPAPIDFDEVVRKVLSGQADEAVAGLRALAAESPEHPLLSEFSLARLCVSLLYTWSLPEEILPLLQFALERYPTSQAANAMLADAQRMIEARRAPR